MPVSKLRKGHKDRVRRRKIRLKNERNRKFNEWKLEQQENIKQMMMQVTPEEQERIEKDVTQMSTDEYLDQLISEEAKKFTIKEEGRLPIDKDWFPKNEEE